MIALDARLATSFTAGLLAAINPCGFVLLPTYLVYFLGMENLRPGVERASHAARVKVSLAVSGRLHERLRRHRRDHQGVDRLVRRPKPMGRRWLIGLGAGRARRRHPVRLSPAASPRPSSTSAAATAVCDRCTCSASPMPSPRSAARSARSRPACSAASAPRGSAPASSPSPCTASAWRCVVTGLTVTLAFANTALLHLLRRGMAWVEQAAGVLLILTGMYLCWYWYSRHHRARAGPSSPRRRLARQAAELRPGAPGHQSSSSASLIDRRRSRSAAFTLCNAASTAS